MPLLVQEALFVKPPRIVQEEGSAEVLADFHSAYM